MDYASHPLEGRQWHARQQMVGISFSLKLEGQDWQCILHAFTKGAERITRAFPLGAGTHKF